MYLGKIGTFITFDQVISALQHSIVIATHSTGLPAPPSISLQILFVHPHVFSLPSWISSLHYKARVFGRFSFVGFWDFFAPFTAPCLSLLMKLLYYNLSNRSQTEAATQFFTQQSCLHLKAQDSLTRTCKKYLAVFWDCAAVCFTQEGVYRLDHCLTCLPVSNKPSSPIKSVIFSSYRWKWARTQGSSQSSLVNLPALLWITALWPHSISGADFNHGKADGAVTSFTIWGLMCETDIVEALNHFTVSFVCMFSELLQLGKLWEF